MNTETLSSLQLFKKKKDTFLYKGISQGKHVLLKCTSSTNPEVREAFIDEYQVMRHLPHPGIPYYYWIHEACRVPDIKEPVLALCMEDCAYARGYWGLSPIPAGSAAAVPDGEEIRLADLPWPQIIRLLQVTSELLSWLLDRGVLYTDLNPSNILIHRLQDTLSLSLVDYTYSYFFLVNPNPSYRLRFSYDLSPDLKGRQLLIQEMGLLLQELINVKEEQGREIVPSGIYSLLETSLNPPDHLSLEDYAKMLETAQRKSSS